MYREQQVVLYFPWICVRIDCIRGVWRNSEMGYLDQRRSGIKDFRPEARASGLLYSKVHFSQLRCKCSIAGTRL